MAIRFPFDGSPACCSGRVLNLNRFLACIILALEVLLWSVVLVEVDVIGEFIGGVGVVVCLSLSQTIEYCLVRVCSLLLTPTLVERHYFRGFCVRVQEASMGAGGPCGVTWQIRISKWRVRVPQRSEWYRSENEALGCGAGTKTFCIDLWILVLLGTDGRIKFHFFFYSSNCLTLTLVGGFWVEGFLFVNKTLNWRLLAFEKPMSMWGIVRRGWVF